MKDKLEEFLKWAKPKNLSSDERNKLWNSISHSIINKGVNNKKTSRYLSILSIIYMKFTFMNKKFTLVPILLVAILIFGSVGTVAYANSSRPGDFLFPVDLAAENARIFFAFSSKKNELRIKFSQERLQEVKEILKVETASADNGSNEDNNTAPSTENTASSTQDAFETATSTSGLTTATTTSQINNGNDEVSENDVVKANTALTVALEYLESSKAKIIANGDEGAVMIIDKMIAELTSLADKHISKISTKIIIKNNNTKVSIEAKTDDLKIKFKLKNKGDDDLKVSFEKKDNKGKDSDKDNIKKSDNDDDDDDRDDDDDKKDNRNARKIIICHNGRSIRISENAYPAHKAHGDHKGECNDNNDNDEDTDDENGNMNDTATTTIEFKEINVFASTNTAEIKWKMNERTDGIVYYSTSSPVTSVSGIKKEDNSFDDDHSVQIDRLTQNTTYYFILVSKDESGNSATSDEQSFTTGKVEDTLSPIISNLISSVGTSTIDLNWDTNEIVTGQVYIATTSPATQDNAVNTKTIAEGTNLHVLFTELTPNTQYYIRIQIKDGSGNETIEDTSLTTNIEPVADTTAPVISSIVIASSTITWVTDEPSTSKVWFSTTTPININTAQLKIDNTLVLNHSLNLGTLIASSTYYYVVSSTDATGNTATSSEQSFSTL